VSFVLAIDFSLFGVVLFLILDGCGCRKSLFTESPRRLPVKVVDVPASSAFQKGLQAATRYRWVVLLLMFL
jgi:hypothetical protein